ncbi:hypothetical protein ABZP36_015677 [Zizania latifolia]
MASSTSRIGSGGGNRGTRARMPVGKDLKTRMLVSAEQPPAAKKKGGSSENKGAQAIFRYMMTKHLKKTLRYYLELELLTGDALNTIVCQAVEKIIASNGDQIPPTQRLMERYISRHQKKIKELAKCLLTRRI